MGPVTVQYQRINLLSQSVQKKSDEIAYELEYGAFEISQVKNQLLFLYPRTDATTYGLRCSALKPNGSESRTWRDDNKDIQLGKSSLSRKFYYGMPTRSSSLKSLELIANYIDCGFGIELLILPVFSAVALDKKAD